MKNETPKFETSPTRGLLCRPALKEHKAGRPPFFCRALLLESLRNSLFCHLFFAPQQPFTYYNIIRNEPRRRRREQQQS